MTTRMTTSISSKAQKIMNNKKKSQILFNVCCVMTVKVNYILDARNNERFYFFDIIIHKKIYCAIKSKDIKNFVKNRKNTCPFIYRYENLLEIWKTLGYSLFCGNAS